MSNLEYLHTHLQAWNVLYLPLCPLRYYLELRPLLDPWIACGDTPDILPGSSTNSPAITGTWNPTTINTSTQEHLLIPHLHPDAGICASTATIQVTIDAPIVPTFDPGTIFKDETPDILPGISTNSPSYTGTSNPSRHKHNF